MLPGMSCRWLACLCILIAPAWSTVRAETPEPAPRTLLLELRDVPEELRYAGPGMLAGDGPYAYGSYRRDRVISVIGATVTMLANQAEYEEAVARGIEVEVLLESDDLLTLLRRGFYGPGSRLDPIYHTYDQLVARAESLASLRPDLIHRYQIGVSQQRGRPIYAYRLSNDATRRLDRPAILLNGAQHADELIGTEVIITLMDLLVTDYGHDSEVTTWMDTLEFHLVPVVNVDGHDIVTSGHDPRWRKNARIFNAEGEYGRYPEGVDINRNYDFNWAFGGSGDSSHVSYRGAHPFSEAENRAMRTLAEQQPMVIAVSYHSQGEVLFYPWIWNGAHAPDHDVILDLVESVAAVIPTMDGRGTYVVAPGGPSSQSYPWFYGRHGVIDFIMEVGKGAHIFPPAVVPDLIEGQLTGLRPLFARAAGPGLAVRVTDAATGEPLPARVHLPHRENETSDRRHADAAFGRHWRLLPEGAYTVLVSHPCYATVRLENVTVTPGAWTPLEVALVAD
jgi:hypothetical protein